MIHLAMPFGAMHGWGICTQYSAKELNRLTPVTLLTDRFSPETVNGPLDYLYLREFTKPIEEFIPSLNAPLPGPVIQAMFNDSLKPWEPRLKGNFNLGYIFSEQTVYDPSCAETAKREFDLVAAGSSWCEMVLRELGLPQVRTVVQGVDPAVFNPAANDKSLFTDRFVVFSGGKFEFRKGQDLVIRAFKELAARHDDVLLVASWHNPWANYMESMRLSPHIDYRPADDFESAVEGVLQSAGIAQDKVILLPPTPHHEMSRVYKNCDLGLFPNRCEGGTNLVLMEFMACGKPALASLSSGHKDVISPHNSLPLSDLRGINITNPDGSIYTHWDDPSLDECVDKLLWAYDHPEDLAALGQRAGQDMQAFSWADTAKRFYTLVARHI